MNAASTTGQRLALAIDLFATGEDLMRQRLKRQHPDLAAEEIEALLLRWLQHRPGAEAGDAAGRPAAWPRRSR